MTIKFIGLTALKMSNNLQLEIILVHRLEKYNLLQHSGLVLSSICPRIQYAPPEERGLSGPPPLQTGTSEAGLEIHKLNAYFSHCINTMSSFRSFQLSLVLYIFSLYPLYGWRNLKAAASKRYKLNIAPTAIVI